MEIKQNKVVEVFLSSEEIDDIVMKYVVSELHSKRLVNMLPDGNLRDFEISFAKRDHCGFHFSLTQKL